jgi:hypothetical protein
VKICKSCGKRKRLTSFYFANVAKTVYGVECKVCCNIRTTKWRKENPNLRRKIDLKFLYNITPERYDEMLVSQYNRCDICKRHKSEFKRRLSVDHNHLTGKVRSLLCPNCNQAIGHLKDDKHLAKLAYDYLVRWETC